VRSFLRLLPEHQVDPAVACPARIVAARGVHRARDVDSVFALSMPLERMYPATESARDWPSVML